MTLQAAITRRRIEPDGRRYALFIVITDMLLVGAPLPAPPMISPHGESVEAGVPGVHAPRPVGVQPPGVRVSSPRATPLDDPVLWTYDGAGASRKICGPCAEL